MRQHPGALLELPPPSHFLRLWEGEEALNIRGACSFMLPRPSSLWAEETFFLSVYTIVANHRHCKVKGSAQQSGLFQQPNPFCCNRSTTNLSMISFLSRTLGFFLFFLSLWIYLWLAETSQQPISQTTWLKVTPHWVRVRVTQLYPPARAVEL